MEKGVNAANVCIAMKKEYDKRFQEEVERILKELYYNPIPNQPRKIGVIQTEKRYIDYLVEHKLISDLKSSQTAGKWNLELLGCGYEVFEKYGDWKNYKKRVVDSKSKIVRAKELAIKYWWIPVVISVLSLVLSIIAIIL